MSKSGSYIGGHTVLQARKPWTKAGKSRKQYCVFQRSTPVEQVSFKKENNKASKIRQVTYRFLCACIDRTLNRMSEDELKRQFEKLPFEIRYQIQEYPTIDLWARSQKKYNDLYIARRALK